MRRVRAGKGVLRGVRARARARGQAWGVCSVPAFSLEREIFSFLQIGEENDREGVSASLNDPTPTPHHALDWDLTIIVRIIENFLFLFIYTLHMSFIMSSIITLPGKRREMNRDTHIYTSFPFSFLSFPFLNQGKLHSLLFSSYHRMVSSQHTIQLVSNATAMPVGSHCGVL